MPPTTRRSATSSSSSRAPRTPSQQQQKTLNFRTATKVTKPSIVHPSKHAKAHDAPTVTVDIPTTHKHKDKSTAPAPKSKAEEEQEVPEKKEEQEDEAEPESLLTLDSPTETDDTPLTTYIDLNVQEKPLSIPSIPPLFQDLPPTVINSLSKITPAKISHYYTTLLSARLTPPVHQSGLSTTEKILRYFDLSSQYGPSIGITRINRWKRAYRMGLNPPIEALKCLMDVEERGGKVQSGFKGVGGGGIGGHKRDERTAFVDEELSSRTAQE